MFNEKHVLNQWNLRAAYIWKINKRKSFCIPKNGTVNTKMNEKTAVPVPYALPACMGLDGTETSDIQKSLIHRTPSELEVHL